MVHGGALVRVVHEIDVALQHLRIERQRVLDHRTVIGVLFVTQHVHEGAVINPVHPQRANKIAFHEPEGLGQQQSIGDLGGHAVHDLSPELHRHGGIEGRLGHAVFGA